MLPMDKATKCPVAWLGMWDGGVRLVPLQPREEGDTAALTVLTRTVPTTLTTQSGCYKNRRYLNQLFPPASSGPTRWSQSHPLASLRRALALA